MLDINLLPWRQKLYANTLKRKKYWIALLSLFLCVLFIVVHVVLLTTINSINFHLLNLKNTQLQMDMVNQDVLLYSNFEMARASQKKWQDFLKKIEKSNLYSVQINKIDYTDKRIFVIGKAQSISEWMRWMNMFEVRNYKISKDKIDMLKFKIVIESM